MAEIIQTRSCLKNVKTPKRRICVVAKSAKLGTACGHSSRRFLAPPSPSPQTLRWFAAGAP